MAIRIKLWPQIDIAVAVDTERGLLAPVVRGVDRKGLAQLAAETAALAERARGGKCTPDELTGSTFTLTNLGMFGIDAFTPIINLPECAILGVGRIKTQPVWAGDHVEPRRDGLAEPDVRPSPGGRRPGRTFPAAGGAVGGEAAFADGVT